MWSIRGPLNSLACSFFCIIETDKAPTMDPSASGKLIIASAERCEVLFGELITSLKNQSEIPKRSPIEVQQERFRAWANRAITTAESSSDALITKLPYRTREAILAPLRLLERNLNRSKHVS